MKKEQIFALIAALYLLDIKERAELIKATVKETGVGAGELFKELKEAGYNPKAEKGTAAPSAEKDDGKPPSPDSEKDSEKDDEKKTAVTLRHKTEYPVYRRAGLALKQKPGEFRVTAEQLAVLKNDKWVEIIGEGEKK
jgi:hypothetical protein